MEDNFLAFAPQAVCPNVERANYVPLVDARLGRVVKVQRLVQRLQECLAARIKSMTISKRPSDTCDVIIVGSGLAGLSCAFELADRGKSVLVLEASDVLGGRTSSWMEDGMPVESGLHKFLGIYRALPALLRRAGVQLSDIISWVDEISILTPEGRNALFGAAPYHHPLRTLLGLLGNTHFISTWSKIKSARLGIAGLAATIFNPNSLDRISIADYARRYSMSEDLIKRLVFTLTQGVFFLSAQDYSAYAAFAPVLEGIKRGLTFRVGAFKGGMSEVLIAPLVSAIRRTKGEVVHSSQVKRLIVQGGGIAGVETSGATLFAKHVALAVSIKAAKELLGEAFPQANWLSGLRNLEMVSAVTIQFELRSPLLDSDRTHFSPDGLCCFAEQSRTTFRHAPGRLSAILFPPEACLRMSPEQKAEFAYEEAARLGLPLREKAVTYRVVEHPQEFYAMTPGSEQLRPLQQTPVPGLSLAGDFTKQPFLASMEGAVISGKRAAAAVLRCLPS